MAEYLTNTTDLTKVAAAIREKGGTSDLLVYPDGFVTAIGNIQTGGGTTPGAPGDITFYDYDGTIVTSWTLEELATKTALPDYPSHEGLTCQGWNWSLADLKTANRKMNVGAMYITDDGKTRIYIRLEEGRTSPMLGVCPNGTVTVDWGDGTTPDTLTGTSTTTVKWTPNHTYAAPGEYVIKLTVDGTMGFYGDLESIFGGAILLYSSSNDNRNYVYRNSVQKIEIGNGVTSIGFAAFTMCYSIASITMPNGVTSIGDYAFIMCYSLVSITMPDGVTSIGLGAFNECHSLVSITMPNSVTSIGLGVFANCRSLSSVTIPNGVTSIGQNAFNACSSLSSITIPNSVASIGESAFSGCESLTSITIHDGVTSIGQSAFGSCSSLTSITIPNSITSIGKQMFYLCYSLSSITIPNGVTSIGESAFSGCESLASITIPNGVTSIGEYAFENCDSLSSITIPDGVTSIGQSAFGSCDSLSSITIPNGVTSIEQNAFRGCSSLSSITIPNSVTSIGDYAFENCDSVAFYDFTACTSVPTLSNTNAFRNIAVDCQIRVPASLVDAWKAATNWSTYAGYIVGA